MTKDYYKILGVAEFESAENIKNAYKKLVRKYHPDIAGNSDDILKRFKEINEAYEILSNKVKKDEYDRARRFYSYAKGEKKEKAESKSFQSGDEKKEKPSFNWQEFIKKKCTNTFKNEKIKAPKRGEDVYSDVEITVLESLSGVVKVINMLQTSICPKCNGRKFTNGAICLHCNGKGEFVNHKRFTVKIPAGIKNNSKIRLAGEGTKGLNGGENGDLYITVHLKEATEYKMEGLNIYKTLPLTPFEAVLGGDIKFNTINGNIQVKIAPNTQNGQKIRIAKCGLTQNQKVGDLILTVEIKIPKNLTQEELSLYNRLKELSTGNIRDDIYGR